MNTTVRRRTLGAALLLSAATAVTACAGIPGAGSPDPQSTASCPAAGIATSIGIDATASFRSDLSKAAHLKVIDSHVRRTATCGGHVTVFAFASSTGATILLFDEELQVDAPTENARTRKTRKLAEQASAVIAEQYDSATSGVTGNGTDVLGMLTLFQQANAQRPDALANNVLVTDGVHNVDINPAAVLSIEAAQALADQQRVPDLSGAEVTIVGIGRQAQGELSSTVIENVTAFWERICQNTQAATCRVSTDGR